MMRAARLMRAAHATHSRPGDSSLTVTTKLSKSDLSAAANCQIGRLPLRSSPALQLPCQVEIFVQ